MAQKTCSKEAFVRDGARTEKLFTRKIPYSFEHDFLLLI